MTGASPERCVKGIADRFAQLIFRRSTESKNESETDINS
jgi:hypothetical protein